MLRFFIRASVVCGTALSFSVAWASPTPYTFTDLGLWTGTPAINDSGTVALGSPGRVWNQGSETPLVGVGSGLSTATGINNSGVVAGYTYTSQPAAHHATTWSGGVPLDLGTLGGQNSYALSINDAGLVVGYSSPSPGDNTPRAAFWSGGVPSSLDSLGTSYSNALDVNNAGTIVGVSGNRAVRWNGTSVVDMSDGFTSAARAVNDLGQIVGFSAVFGGPFRAAIWGSGGIEDIGTLGGAYSVAYNINVHGQVVGYSADASGRETAFIWSDGVLTDLNSLLPADDVSKGWYLTSAGGINASGAIVGQAVFAGQAYAFLLQPSLAVPEPQTLALSLLALGAVAMAQRRRRISSGSLMSP